MGEATEYTRAKRKNKAIKIAALSLLGLILLLILAAGLLFGSEIASLMTLHQIKDTELFTMEYKGDYGLDALLRQGASTDGELVTFVSRQLLRGIPLEIELPDLSCSTFLAQTAEGDYLFGRNFDNYHTPVLLLTTKPENAYASLSVVNLAFIGYSSQYLPDEFLNRIPLLGAPFAPLDGVNEKGLAIGVLQINIEPTRQDTGKTKITTTSAIRMILDKAANVEEALALLRQFDMRSSAGGCYHFQIVDASGRSVVVEYIEDEMIVLEENYATNFLLAPGDWYNVGGGQNRYEILARTLEETKGILSEEQSMDLLEAVKQNSTQWSVVYNTAKKTAAFCLHGDFENPYFFELK